MKIYPLKNAEVIFLIPQHIGTDHYFQSAIAVLSNGDTLLHNGAFWSLMAMASYFNGKTYAELKSKQGVLVLSGKIRLKQ